MSDFEDLQKKKDLMVDEKNQSFKKKWEIEDELSQLKQSKAAHRLKGDVSAVNKANLKEKNLQNQLYELNNRINNINKDLTLIKEQIDNKEFEKINETYILNERLSKREISKLINKSRDISERFDSEIKQYSSFLKTINGHLKVIAGNEIWEYDLDLVKVELQEVIENLQIYQMKYKEFDQFNVLVSILDDADENLKNIKSNFNESKKLSLNLNTKIMEYKEFSRKIDVNLKNISEKYSDEDFELIKLKIKYNLLLLSKNKKFCYQFGKSDELNDILDKSANDLNEMKSIFNESYNILIKFDSVINDFQRFLTKIDGKIIDFNAIFDCEDFLKEMRNQIGTQRNELLIFFKNYFYFNDLDRISERLDDKSKYLEAMKTKFVKSKNLHDDFEDLIKDYSIFLNEIDADLKKKDSIISNDDLNLLKKDVNAKMENLINHRNKCFDFNSFDELNNLIDNFNEDLNNLEDSFYQRKNGMYDSLVLNIKSLIDDKLDICSKLKSKVSLLIDNAEKFDVLIDSSQLLENLKEVNAELSQEFQNMIEIRNNFDKRILENSTQAQIYKKELSHPDNLNHLNNLIEMLNQLDFDHFEKYSYEQEKVYEKLAIQNENAGKEDVKKIVHNFEKCFDKPMFRRQLKRYNLNEEELKLVKHEIIDDIINLIIVDENANFKQIIKARCKEFKETHSEIDDDKLDNILDMDDFKEIDENILLECKDLVKKDLVNGNVTINNAKLKFRKYINKKLDEDNQLKELERIKNNPNIPRIKIHLSQEESNEVYDIVQNEIISEYGIRDTVENRVYYWCNQRIRENQSNARGRLNVIKREFSNLTQLNLQEQNEFIIKIEFMINENKIMPYEITEENIIRLSNDFMNNNL